MVSFGSAPSLFLDSGPSRDCCNPRSIHIRLWPSVCNQCPGRLSGQVCIQMLATASPSGNTVAMFEQVVAAASAQIASLAYVEETSVAQTMVVASTTWNPVVNTMIPQTNALVTTTSAPSIQLDLPTSLSHLRVALPQQNAPPVQMLLFQQTHLKQSNSD